MDRNRDLADMGVTPGMHTAAETDSESEQLEKRKSLFRDPVALAEWISGQIRDQLEQSGLTTISGPAFLEHTESMPNASSTQAVELIPDMTVAPKSARDFMIDVAFVGAVRNFLDYHAGPSHSSQQFE